MKWQKNQKAEKQEAEMIGWILDDSSTVCQPVQPVNHTIHTVLQDDDANAIYRHVVQHRLAEQHRHHHQRLPQRRP